MALDEERSPYYHATDINPPPSTVEARECLMQIHMQVTRMMTALDHQRGDV